MVLSCVILGVSLAASCVLLKDAFLPRVLSAMYCGQCRWHTSQLGTAQGNVLGSGVVCHVIPIGTQDQCKLAHSLLCQHIYIDCFFNSVALLKSYWSLCAHAFADRECVDSLVGVELTNCFDSLRGVVVAMAAAEVICSICRAHVECGDLEVALACGHVHHENCLLSYCLAGGYTMDTVPCQLCKTSFRSLGSAALSPIPAGQVDPMTPTQPWPDAQPRSPEPRVLTGIVILCVWCWSQ